MRTRGFLMLWAVIPVVLLFSCQKKWKETTPLDVSFNYNSQNLPGQLVLTSATINLSHIKFSGKRKQGGDVSFENSTQRQLTLNSGGSPVINFEIPQGDYTSANYELTFSRQDTLPVITLVGVYTDSNNVVKQVFINISGSVFLSAAAKNTSGGSEIAVSTGRTEKATITMDISYWMQVLSDDLFEGADCGQSGGQEIMTISKDENQDIYQSIVNRLTVPPMIVMQ